MAKIQLVEANSGAAAWLLKDRFSNNWALMSPEKARTIHTHPTRHEADGEYIPVTCEEEGVLILARKGGWVVLSSSLPEEDYKYFPLEFEFQGETRRYWQLYANFLPGYPGSAG